jgi:hypothetical protein
VGEREVTSIITKMQFTSTRLFIIGQSLITRSKQVIAEHFRVFMPDIDAGLKG